MNYSIFIRTYDKDYEWLVYCLRSLRIHAPQADVNVVSPHGFPESIFSTPNVRFWVVPSKHNEDGYVDQQITKLLADTYCSSEYILHIDSDTVLIDDPQKLFIDGRPQMLRTPYAQVGEAIAWKSVTEKNLGWGVSHEYMRRLPLMYPRALYERLRIHLNITHTKTFPEWARAVPSHQLSEFNLLGAFAFEKMHDAFHWIDTEVDPLPSVVAKQHWSWGGITPDIKASLEALCSPSG